MDLISQLANNNGLLGLLLAIAIMAIVYLFKKLVEEKDKRLIDAKESRDVIVEPLKNIQNTLSILASELQNTGKRK